MKYLLRMIQIFCNRIHVLCHHIIRNKNKMCYNRRFVTTPAVVHTLTYGIDRRKGSLPRVPSDMLSVYLSLN